MAPSVLAAAAEQSSTGEVVFGPAGGDARPFTFDRTSGLLWRDDEAVSLPPRVVGVLELLLSRPGSLVSKQELIATVWRDAFVSETSLTEAISQLRQVLGDDRQQPTFIQTLHRRGYRLIADVAAVPDAGDPGGVSTAPPAGERSMSMPMLVAWTTTLFAVLITAVTVWRFAFTPPVPERLPVRFTLSPPEGVLISHAPGSVAASDDGELIAFAGCRGTECGLYLRPLSDGAATFVAGTANATAPFFSPDARSLGFFAKGSLQTIALAGGSPESIVSDVGDARGATWLRDGRIVFAGSSNAGLRAVQQAGGISVELTHPDSGNTHGWPSATADGIGLVFTVDDVLQASRPYAATYTFRRKSWHRLLDGADSAVANVPGYVVASRDGELIAARFDSEASSMRSRAVGLGEVMTASAAEDSGSARGPWYALSGSGHLVRVDSTGRTLQVTLNWSTDLRRLVPQPSPPLPR